MALYWFLYLDTLDSHQSRAIADGVVGTGLAWLGGVHAEISCVAANAQDVVIGAVLSEVAGADDQADHDIGQDLMWDEEGP